ncbi:hypothetical protein F2P81_002958 [Scophthalmus maximus]|uniref:Uncharacterized protein n=1 Tax=Scophthalmus maximus TaxID=52904 RepID=A0A6A4TJB5_SCOMX|nr:hypothetical protein F2P81_002958 [Scophthalmus maximus]
MRCRESTQCFQTRRCPDLATVKTFHFPDHVIYYCRRRSRVHVFRRVDADFHEAHLNAAAAAAGTFRCPVSGGGGGVLSSGRVRQSAGGTPELRAPPPLSMLLPPLLPCVDRRHIPLIPGTRRRRDAAKNAADFHINS